MKNNYDSKEIQCINCGHKWILICDEEITQNLYGLWFKKAWIEHYKMFGGEYENEEN